MAVKKWIVSPSDTKTATFFADKLGLNPFATLLAVSRGFCTEDQLLAFFASDDAPMLSDPFTYKDMDKAVDRINDAIDSFERIAVFGDYDADGVTATALLSAYLEMREANFFYMLPDRAEGYGLSELVIDRLHEQGTKLIITVDNGINSVREAAYAKSLGIDMVITDHHHTGDVLPDAVAVVNPHRADCPSVFKDLAGVGVAFKLVCALEGGESNEDILAEYGDLVAIGTVADIVPLVDENRTIVRQGIRTMIEQPRPGILAIRNITGTLDKPFNSTSVAFTIAPRLNAAGRMGSAMQALDLLLCEEEEDALELAQAIEHANAERQKTEIEIFDLAERQLNQHPERKLDRVLVCDGEGWHQGVIGIVASRIVEKYGKPCIIISKVGDYAKGSGRSLEGFSLYDALSACTATLTQFGGHTLAAGLSLPAANIDAFRNAINAYAAQSDMPFPLQHVDLKLNPKFINTDILNALSALEPFGASNPRPVFGLFSMRLDSITPLSGGKHIRLNLSKKGTHISTLRFGISPEAFPFPVGSTIDLAVTLDANTYMGETKVSVLVRNIRFSDFADDAYFDGLRQYNRFLRQEPVDTAFTSLVPDRNFIGEIYKSLRSMGGTCRSTDCLCMQIEKHGMEICPVLLSIDALCELGLAEHAQDDSISLLAAKSKVNLENSVILQNARLCIR